MDDLRLLALHVAWGADEALCVIARDRITPVAAPSAGATPRSAGGSVVELRAVSGGDVGQAELLASAARTVEELRAVLAGFSACPLQSTAINLVFAAGNPQSRLMVLGDAPGEEEDRTGIAFSGPGGQLLDRMLASIGLDRDGVLLTYAIPWRPPGNRKPTAHERALCLPFMRRHIALVRPSRLVVLGTAATASLIEGSPASLRRLRGTWQKISVAGLAEPLAALPTFSPEQLLATRTAKREAWEDLLSLRTALDLDRA